MRTRATFITAAAALAVFFGIPAKPLETAVERPGVFRLSGDGRVNLLDVQTGEQLSIVYRDSRGAYNESTLDAIDRVLRCHGDQEMHPISLKLVELVDYLQDHFGASQISVVSGYRSPDYNEALRRKIRRVAHDSLHIQGMAMDIQFPGVGKKELGTIARSLGSGGVGVYARSSFVHVDVGPVRSW